MKTRELYVVVLVIFVMAGLILPATQASGRPRPTVAAVLRVMFLLDRPLRERHLDDSIRTPINVVTTLAWGWLVAFLLSRLPWFRPSKNANTKSLEPTAAMRFRSTTINSHDAAIAGASALLAAVAQFCRSFVRPINRMHRIDKITDIVAADDWRYRTTDGGTAVSRIEIGRPERVLDDPNGDWCCPVFVEHFTGRIVPAYGVGPVDALMNAIVLVRGFADQIGSYTPRASDHPDEPTAEPGACT